MIAMIVTTAILGLPLWLAFADGNAETDAQRVARICKQRREDRELIAAAHALVHGRVQS